MLEVTSEAVLEFGEYRLDTTRRLLMKNGEAVPLTHKAFEMLALMVRNSGRIIEKDELLREIWPDTFVEEGSLSRNISVLRKVLGEGPSDHQFIQTIPKQGYRFVAPVRKVDLRVESNRTNGDGVAVQSFDHVPCTSSRRNPMPYAIAAGILAAVAVTAVAVYFSTRPLADPRRSAMNVTRFTSTGKAMDAVISRDGKYVAYVISDGGKQSLWVKQVASGSEVQVVQPADVNYQGLAFSADGNYVFYNIWDKVHVGEIFRIPVLGGDPVKVVKDVMPLMSVSPDDKEIAFVRSISATSESVLVAARTDGSSERVIAKRGSDSPGWFGGPSWAPDGRSIAYASGSVGELGQSFVRVAIIPAEGGSERVVSENKFVAIGSLAWHRDGKHLIITASEQYQMPHQLWRVNTNTGEANRISNDVSGYNGVSLTADSKSLVTTQGDYQSNVYLGGETPSSEWKKLTSGRYEGLSLAWTPDGRIVSVSQESGNDDIWIMNADGTGRKRLTNDPSIDAYPAVSFDGKAILFASLRSGVPHIYRMDIDGGNQVQLTNGQGEWAPITAPTKPMAIFHSSNGRGLWKMNLDGSGQERVNEVFSYMPAVSPDGTKLAYNYWDDQAKPEQLRQAMLDITTGIQKFLPPVPKTAIRHNSNVILKWSPDGKSIAFVDDRDGVSNIWRQPIAGGPPQRMTNFNDSYIYSFDWSRDGRIAAARGTFTFDVVLITDFE